MEVKLSQHAKGRSSLRLISKDEVIEALGNGKCFNQEDGTIKCFYNNLKVIFRVEEGVIVIITMMYTSKFKNQIRRYARKNKISMRKATKLLKVS